MPGPPATNSTTPITKKSGEGSHRRLRSYEKIVLEGFQAWLAWMIVLRKRDRFHPVFANFDPEAVACSGGRLITWDLEIPEVGVSDGRHCP